MLCEPCPFWLSIYFYLYNNLHFTANEEMSVWCENLTSPDTTEDKDTPNTTKDEDNSLLEQIGSVCSPHFVIILGKHRLFDTDQFI